MFLEIMAVASVINGIVGANAASKQAAAQARQARENAQYLRQQADFARFMAELDISAADVEHQRHTAASESLFAAAGVSMSGSVLAALGESEKAQEQNHFRRLVAAENDANYMIKRADINDRMAGEYEEAGRTRALTSVLGGVIQGASFGYQAGMHKPGYWKGMFGSSTTVLGGSGGVIRRDNFGNPLGGSQVGIGVPMPSVRPVGARQFPGFASPGPYNPYTNMSRGGLR